MVGWGGVHVCCVWLAHMVPWFSNVTPPRCVRAVRAYRKCDKCKNVSAATSTTWLYSLPDFLVINLKRFVFYPQHRKVTTQVVFPVVGLDLAAYVSPEAELDDGESTVYDLVSVTVRVARCLRCVRIQKQKK